MYELIVEQLLPAMIQVESAGNPKAVSLKGAMGLLQIMPETWAEWSRKLGEENLDPFDPEANKRVAAAYLQWLLRQFDGDLKLALAAYNYGIGNVQRLTAQHGRSIIDIYAALPRETQEYLWKILKCFFPWGENA